MKRKITFVAAVIALVAESFAEELRGKVSAVSGEQAQILLEGELEPNLGDSVTIYFKLPDAEDEVFVGSGKVSSVDGNIASVKMESGSPVPQKDQLARISSANPKPKATKGTARGEVPHSPVAAESWQGRVWDFSSGKGKPRSEHVELADGKTWGMKGHHLRFLQPGASWLETTFSVPESHKADPERPMVLRIQHLSSSPDGKKSGHSPVRITLNKKEIFNGSPSKIDWMQSEIDISDQLEPGSNTLRWEYRPDASTHYWLRSFAISRKKAPSSDAATKTRAESSGDLGSRLVGKWQGGRHVTQYFADGTFILDPDIVPQPIRESIARWRVEGNKLITIQAGQTFTETIVSLTESELITKNQHGTFHHERVK